MKINKLLLALSLASISTIAAADGTVSSNTWTISNPDASVVLQLGIQAQTNAAASSIAGGKSYARSGEITVLGTIDYTNMLIQPNPSLSVTGDGSKVKTSGGGDGLASATGIATGLVIFPVSAIPAYHDAFIFN